MEVKEAEVIDLNSWEEADRRDMEMSRFFKPQINIPYTLTFSAWKLTQRKVPDFKDKTKMNDRVVLELQVDNINGKKLAEAKEWGILPMKLRQLFRIPCMNGNITKKKYQVMVSGEGANKQYSLSELGDK